MRSYPGMIPRLKILLVERKLNDGEMLVLTTEGCSMDARSLILVRGVAICRVVIWILLSCLAS